MAEKLSSTALNQLNLAMRQQPWYQAWFRARGLNPNQVQLTDPQRKELTALITTNGMPAPAGTLVDKAGNLNTHHGFAGLPTWAKIAVGAAPVAAAMLVPGVREATLGNLGHIFGLGVTQAPAAPAASILTGAGPMSSLPAVTALNGAPIMAAGGAPSVGASLGLATAPKVASLASGGFSVGDIVKSAVAPAISSVTGIVAQRSSNAAADRAAAIGAKTAAEQLQYLRDVEAARQREHARTEALNFQQYQQGQARLAPYRAIGESAIRRFGQPITVGSAMGI